MHTYYLFKQENMQYLPMAEAKILSSFVKTGQKQTEECDAKFCQTE